MAGVFSKQRFGFASETTIEELKKFSKNPNTVKSTSFWLNVWETWCKQKNIVNKIEENEPEKLNKLLETFYAEVKNKNGDDYEPDSLRVMIAALDKHLRWLDWIFLGRNLPSLSLNYVGMSKDIEKKLPQLYYIKMKIS